MEDWSAFSRLGSGGEELREAKEKGLEVTEDMFGRVYVQGLSLKSNPELAILFDKVPTPGGDHCHVPQRIIAAPSREVLFVHLEKQIIQETDWPDFARNQVDLLVRERFPQGEAKRLYGIR